MTAMRKFSDSSGSVPFVPELFANRREEQQIFLDLLYARKLPKRHLEFTGIAGQGKTQFLKWIYHNPRGENYFPAYIDFEADADYYRAGSHAVLKAIAEQFASTLDSEAFHSFRNVIISSDDSCDETSLIASFNQDLTKLLNFHKIIFCLDSTEQFPSANFQQLEELVLYPHAAHDNFMFVAAGQMFRKWNPKIHRQIQRRKLANFSPECIDEQAEKLLAVKEIFAEDKDVILEKIRELTLGHPLSCYTLLRVLTHRFEGALNQFVVQDVQRLQEAIEILIEDVIEGRILRRVDSSSTPALKDILWHLAPLRWIEIGSLKHVLSHFLGEQLRQVKITYFQELMQELLNKDIFIERDLVRGSRITPVVRNILLSDMRLRQRRSFIEIHGSLHGYYDRCVRKTHDATQIKNILETLYHFASFLRETQPNYIDSLLQEQLHEYLQMYFTREAFRDDIDLLEQFSRLASEIQQDRDLHKLANIDGLLSLLDDYRKETLHDIQTTI